MNELIAQILGPDSSLLGRVLGLVALAAVVIFYFMATASLNDRRDSKRARREAAKADEQAEAIARQARREMAAKDSSAE